MSAIIPTPAQLAACEGLLAISRAESGVVESAGDRDNPRILEYLATVSKPGWAKAGLLRDATPWCSAHVNWCALQAKLPGTGLANARSWLAWGDPIALDALVPGCVLIFSRPPLPWNGHVALYAGRTLGELIMCQGGNQRDRVCEAPYGRARLLGARVPSLEMLTPELTS